MAHRLWTTTELAKAVAMRGAGHSYAAIAAELDRKPHTVEQAVYRAKSRLPQPPQPKRRRLDRKCSACAIGIGDLNKSGRCKPCNIRALNTDHDLRLRRGATQARQLRENPHLYRRKCAILAANRAKARINPEYVAMLKAQGPRLNSYRTPETEARRIAALIKANKRRRHTWLPDCYREDYRKMIRHSRMRAVEAKRIILEQVEADKRRATAALSPFERQQRALERGATLVANDRGHSLDNPGNYGEHRWEVGRVG